MNNDLTKYQDLGYNLQTAALRGDCAAAKSAQTRELSLDGAARIAFKQGRAKAGADHNGLML